jgi:hypothetical protein
VPCSSGGLCSGDLAVVVAGAWRPRSQARQATPTAEGIPVEGAPAGGDAAEVDPAGIDAGLFTKQVLATNVKQVHAVVAADFDGDGDNDFAATDYVNHQVVYFRKDGNGYTRTLLDGNLKGAYPLSVGDVNKDGKLDIWPAAIRRRLHLLSQHRRRQLRPGGCRRQR